MHFVRTKMLKAKPLSEAVSLLDSIIDDSLDCQEQIVRSKFDTLPDFANCLEKIICVKNKVSSQFYSQLESLILSLRPPKPTPAISIGSSQAEQLLPFFTDCLYD